MAKFAPRQVSARDRRVFKAARLDSATGLPANLFGSTDSCRNRGRQTEAIYQWILYAAEGRRAGRTDRADRARGWLKRDSGKRPCLVRSPAVPDGNFKPRPRA